MNINEIRVGNYLLRQGKVVEVTKICRHGIIYIDNNPCPFLISNFSPIALDGGVKYSLTQMVLEMTKQQFSEEILIAHVNNDYLHMIQNHYADIVGTEIYIDFDMYDDIVRSVE